MTKHEDASPVAFEDMSELEQAQYALAMMVRTLAVLVVTQPNGDKLAGDLATALERHDYAKLATLGANMTEAVVQSRVAAETGGATAH